MNELSKREILFIHDEMAKRYGGDTGIRDEGLLDSLSKMPYQTFGGEELFPTVFDKAARFLTGFVGYQAFVDGNKRMGAATALTFLKINGFEPDCTETELHSLVIDIAKNTDVSFENVSDFFSKKSIQVPIATVADALQWMKTKFNSVFVDLARGAGERLETSLEEIVLE